MLRRNARHQEAKAIDLTENLIFENFRNIQYNHVSKFFESQNISGVKLLIDNNIMYIEPRFRPWSPCYKHYVLM